MEYDNLILVIENIKEYQNGEVEFNDMCTDARCYYTDTLDQLKNLDNGKSN